MEFKERKTTEEQIRAEHSTPLQARKTLNSLKIGLTWDADNDRSLAPINQALAASTAVVISGLEGKKKYLGISSVPLHMLEADAGDATVADFYVPANTYFFYEVRSETNRLSVLSPSAGFVQFSELSS